MAPPNVWVMIDALRVVAANVIPVTNSAAVRSTDHLFVLKMVYAVTRLTIPRIAMCGGAAEISIAK